MIVRHKEVFVFSILMTMVFLMGTWVYKEIEERHESKILIEHASKDVQARLQHAQKLLICLKIDYIIPMIFKKFYPLPNPSAIFQSRLCT